MQAVSADIYLGSAVSRESLLRACRLLAERLSYRLERQGLVWQRLAVRVDLEGANLFLARQFSRTQTPKSLGLHLERIILDLQVESPVEKNNRHPGLAQPGPLQPADPVQRPRPPKGKQAP